MEAGARRGRRRVPLPSLSLGFRRVEAADAAAVAGPRSERAPDDRPRRAQKVRLDFIRSVDR